MLVLGVALALFVILLLMFCEWVIEKINNFGDVHGWRLPWL